MKLTVCIAASSALLLVAGCSDSTPSNESLTPQITVDASAPDDALLEASDVSQVAGEVVVEPFDTAQVFENPDPRGPCGGPAPPPPIDGAAGRVLTSDRATVIHLVIPRSDETDAYMAAMLSDIVDPCGPYESVTNVGDLQEVSQIEVIELPEVEGFATTAQFAHQGRANFGAAGAAQSNESMTLFMVLAPARVPLADVQSLVERASDRL